MNHRATTPRAMPRRHDIDALRALAFALLILYHWCMLYVGGEDWDWHLKSSHTGEWMQPPMLLVNRWRMDLIFLISGLSVHFLLRDTRAGRFVATRTWRLLVPLVFGMFVIVPVQPYAEAVANGQVQPDFADFMVRYWTFASGPYDLTWNHLWYLAYLWVYTLVFAALLPLLRRLPNPLAKLRGGWLLTLPALPLLLYTLTLQPLFEASHDLVNDWYLHAVYFSVFVYGWWIGTDAGLWTEFARLRHRATGWALGVFGAYATLVFGLPENSPDWQANVIYVLRNAYIWLALSAILGWGHVLLNRPFRWLPWANEAVYPWYVLHQSLIVLCAYWLLPLELGPVAEPLLVLAGTVGGCALLHAGIRRMRWVRPLFGMKAAPKRVASAHSLRRVPA